MAHQWLDRRRASAQNFISGVVLFFTVGIYLAVLGLGAGGGKPTSQRVSDISNACCYGTFAIFGFFTGSIMNKLGPKLTMLIGVFGYPLYVAGFFYYDRTGGQGFPIAAGTILGLCAPMLWSVSGFIQWAYATEAEKGKYISVQYFINQVGSVVGSLVAFIIILQGTSTDHGSPTSVYIAFIILMCVAFFCVGFGIINPARVFRADGTHVAVFKDRPYMEELKVVGRVLRDWRVLLMLPVIFASELPLAIMPSINAYYFSLRTRAMNSLMFYVMALPSSVVVTLLTDRTPFSRKMRGFISLGFLAVVDLSGWTALTVWIYASDTFASPPLNGVDWTSDKFAGPFVLYLVFSILYTCHQLIGMWVMGTFTNEPRVLAVYGGLWKGVAAGGLAVSFGMQSSGVSYLTQCIMMFVLHFVSFPIMFTLVGFFGTETNYGKEEGVIVPRYAEEKYQVKTILDGHNVSTSDIEQELSQK